MKRQLIKHFFMTFCLALITVAFVNIAIVYIESRQFFSNADEYLYGRHYVNKIVQDFATDLTLSTDGEIVLSDNGLNQLNHLGVTLQVLNEANDVIYSVGNSNHIKPHYSNVELYDLFQTLEGETVFINEVTLQEQTYSYLLFFPSKVVKRFVFHYNTQEIMTLHNIPLMVTVNVLLTLVMSFIYATFLSRPLNGIIQNIMALSKGEAIHKTKKPSLYGSVEERLDELALKLERAEFERQQMETLREEWIGNITHDIKTPLTSIRGNAEILGDDEYEIDLTQRQLYAHVILQQADYIKTLVDDLNLSTRLKNGNLTLQQKPVNVVSLLREVVIDFLNNPKYEGYEIEFLYQEEYLVLTLDELLMKRVFINLITNAMVHNPQGTKIKVEVQQKEQTTIKISDEGVGINKEDLPHIFTRYYRGTNTSKSSNGSGLGLAIAYDIVKVHGGEIRARSAVGNGLEIIISLD